MTALQVQEKKNLPVPQVNTKTSGTKQAQMAAGIVSMLWHLDKAP